MKRILALLLALMLIFSLAACGDETVIISDDSSSSVLADSADNSSGEPDAKPNDNPSSAPQTGNEGSSSQKPADGGHTHSYTTKTTAATCQKKGSIKYTCACGDTYTEELDYAHNFSGYFCTKCDRINPEKANEYLGNFIKENGEEGALMSSEYLMSNDVVLVFSYDNEIILKKSGYEGSDQFSYEINLSKSTYKIQYGSKNEAGSFTAAKLTKTTKVCKNAELDNYFHTLLALTASGLKSEGIKVTLSDLGLKAY
ncbi:MAG: hypothetical protein IKL62_03570 [Clostridia bacterium]|nr:hypothetical protein [Clostridia bacterium]